MKILRIRLKNLNSLEGEWEIDFTHSTYRANPIFAISGPTGSGKSTLLDAICLALYGRTPRLKIISKSINEIMTKQTGECFAEVTFETLKGCYRCHWSQHRSRKKPDGELQQPRHEIVDHADNRVLEHMIKKVAAKVEEVTGMAFDQFTRSILLAQGSFAAFLQASPDERAPLLEHLTGTEIYSRISQKVHEITAQQEKVCERANDTLTGLAVLSTDEAETLTMTLKERSGEVARKHQELASLAEKISWLEKLSSLNQEIETLTEKHDKAQALKRSQAEQRSMLQRAKVASLHVSQHDFLTKMKQAQAEETSAMTALGKERQTVEKKIEEQGKILKNLKIKHKDAEVKLEEERKLIASVRSLDINIANQNDQQDQCIGKVTTLEAEISRIKNSLASITEVTNEKSAKLEKCQEYLKNEARDASLNESLPLLGEQVKHLEELIGKNRNHEQQGQKTQKKRKKHAKELKRWQKLQGKSNVILCETEKQYRSLNDEAAAIRRDFPHLSQRLEECNIKLNHLEKLQAVAGDMKQLNLDIASQQVQYRHLGDQLQDAEKREAELQSGRKIQLQLIGNMEKITILAQRIKNYEQERAMLKTGCPCPLCGATQHPYRQDGEIPAMDEKTEELTKARKRLITLQEELIEAQTATQFFRKQREEVGKSQKRQQDKLRQHNNLFTELKEDFTSLSTTAFQEDLQRAIDDSNREKRLLHQKSLYLEKTEQQLIELRIQVDVLKEENTNLERNLAAEKYALQQCQQNEQDLLETIKNFEDEIKERESQLGEKFASFGLTEAGIDTFEQFLKQLQNRHELYQQERESANRLREEIQILAKDQHGLQVSLSSLEKEYLLQQHEKDKLAEKRAGLIRERGDLYGKKSPDIEEEKFTDLLREATGELEKLQEEDNLLNNRIITLNTQLESLNRSITKRADQLLAEERQLIEDLQKQGFASIAEFTKAILPEQHITELEDEFGQTDETLHQLATLLKGKRDEYRQQHFLNLTSENIEHLNRQQQQSTESLQLILQEIGRIQGRLEENQKLLNEQQQKREELEKQRNELKRWQRLDHLIGSANGKKFRNFAQGITFDIMVDHANNNLHKMTDRYLLVRDKLHPLKLNIIDNYRGGDIRSTQNLSGGESFLVSLALALGLSGMAGDNVQVDSLFLDEGFGTLDEETLDTALHTLATLQQQGKMIGIISHVTMLKERLDTHIQLIPQIGGYSLISGPGIQNLSSKS